MHEISVLLKKVMLLLKIIIGFCLTVDVEVIKTGEINFVFDDTHYRIVVNEGYFSLFVKEGSQLSEGSSHYIGTRVRVHDGAYWPAQDAVTYDDRQKQKKAAAIYMGGNKLEVG